MHHKNKQKKKAQKDLDEFMANLPITKWEINYTKGQIKAENTLITLFEQIKKDERLTFSQISETIDYHKPGHTKAYFKGLANHLLHTIERHIVYLAVHDKLDEFFDSRLIQLIRKDDQQNLQRPLAENSTP